MNPDTPRPPREELEVRLTALLLGELPAEEAAALREIIAKDAQLAGLHERLKRAMDLVRAAATTASEPATTQAAPLKLSDTRRQKLLAHFKTVAPKEFINRPRRREWSWLVPLSAAAAAIALLAAITIPNFTRARESAPANSILNNLRILEGAKDQWALENNKSPTDMVNLGDLKDYLKGGTVRPVLGENYTVGKVSDPITADIDAAQAKKTFGGVATKQPPQAARGQRARLNADGELTFVDKNGMPSAGAQSGGVYSVNAVGYNPMNVNEEKLLAAKSSSPSEGTAPSKAFKGDGRPLLPGQGSAREVESLEARHTGATLRQQIVLPPSGAQDDWANAKLEGPSNQGGRGLPSGTLLAQSTAGGRGGVFGGGGGIGGGGGAGFGPVADAQPDSNVRNAWLFGNPKSIGILESPAPGGVGSTNRFIFALDAPPAAGDFKTFGLQPRQPAGPNQPPLIGEAKFAESSQTDNRALGFAWNARELEAERRMGIQGGTAPSFADPRLKAKPDIRDADADKLDGALSLSTINGRALQEKRVGAGAAGAPATPAPGAAPARSMDRLDRSGPVAPKPDGIDDRYAYQVPRLGDAPELGRFYKINPELSEAEGKPGSKVESLPQITGKDLTRLNEVATGVSQNAERKERGDQKIASVGEPAEGIPLEATSKFFTNTGKFIIRNAATTEESVRQKLSTVVLPPLTPDTTAGVPIAVTGSLIPENEAAKAKPSVSERSVPAPTLEPETLRRLQSARNEAEKDYSVRNEALEDAQKKEGDQPTNSRPPFPASEPQPEVQTRDNAYSTFALNVSDVSFKLAEASLEKGVMPEPATVRSEEFINAFDYRDPEPPPGVPIAFAWERARYPFAHNRDLLRFSVKTAAAGRLPGRPLNLVLLLDNSGSMERADRVQIIHEALRVLATQLQLQDKLSVVTFARTARLWVDGVPGNQAGQVAEAVSSLIPQGGTNLGDAMDLAYQIALGHYLANGVNRIVLLTDGAANLGNVDPDALKQKVEAHRKQGIALDCFGIGWEGYNDDLLEILSRNGDGRYGFINTPEEAASDFAGQLAGALRVAASDVKVQVEFHPGRVTAYRQIGYAKHQLTKEQFRDNTVDAAEIGAAESGNALYVAEVNARGEGPVAIVRVRYKVPGTADYREHEWAVPYTGNAVSLDQASPVMRLAATASAFSEWLVSSRYAAEITPDRLLGYLGGVPETYGADARSKKLEWMIRQAKSLAGK